MGESFVSTKIQVPQKDDLHGTHNIALILRSIARRCVSKDGGVSRDRWSLLRDGHSVASSG
jgi:hypothetical protein